MTPSLSPSLSNFEDLSWTLKGKSSKFAGGRR